MHFFWKLGSLNVSRYFFAHTPHTHIHMHTSRTWCLPQLTNRPKVDHLSPKTKPSWIDLNPTWPLIGGIIEVSAEESSKNTRRRTWLLIGSVRITPRLVIIECMRVFVCVCVYKCCMIIYSEYVCEMWMNVCVCVWAHCSWVVHKI